MRVADVSVDQVADGVRLTAVVVWDRASHGRDDLEMTYHGVDPRDVCTPGDALLATVLVPAMAFRENVVVEAPVSQRLLSNAERIVAAFTSWIPRWHPTEVSAPAVDRSALDATTVAACFSGGIDSFHTVLAPRDEPITTLVSMKGFSSRGPDDPAPDAQMRELAIAARRLAKRHIVVDTNNFRWGQRYLPRTARLGSINHGAALAAMVLGLGGLISRCYIASSEPFPKRPWGSHPAVDPLWSTESLEMIHDFPDKSRIDKVGLVAQSDVALDTLLVCNAVRVSHENCRTCEKCQAAALMLHISGVLDRAKTLGPVTPETLRRVRIGVWHHRIWENLWRQTNDPQMKRAVASALLKAKARRVGRPLGNAMRALGLR